MSILSHDHKRESQNEQCNRKGTPNWNFRVISKHRSQFEREPAEPQRPFAKTGPLEQAVQYQQARSPREKRHASEAKNLPALTKSMKLQVCRARPLVCIAIFAPAKQGIHRVESGPLQMQDK